MRFLVVSQYFWPENFRINDLVAELVRRGHEVTVLTGEPNYPDGEIFSDFLESPANFSQFEGAAVVRVKMLPRGRGGLHLMLNYMSFALSASIFGPWKLRGRTFDGIFVFQPSPVTVGLPAIVLKWLKRAPIAFWVLDLWPQSLTAVGAVRSRILLGVFDQLVRYIYSQCDVVLVQSRAFVETVSEQLKNKSKIVYFPSWAEPAEPVQLADLAPEIEYQPELFNIVFTGNIGEAQDFGAVLDAAEILRNEPVRWIIVGDGRRADWVANEIKTRNLGDKIAMPGRFPLGRMPSFFKHADALLVSLRDEPIFGLTIPGKVQTYLATGKPVLAMLNGEGGDVIKASGAGLVAPAGDSAALAEHVMRLKSLPKTDREKMGKKGIQVLARDFNRETLLDRLIEIYAGLAPSSNAQPKR